jgi:PAS domain S-box-containing protein
VSEKDPDTGKARSFSSILLIYMILLALCIVGFMAVSNYLYTKNNFEYESHLFQVQTEQNIIEAMRLKNGVWNFYDKTLNDQMNEGLLLVVAEYNRTGSNTDRMDLAAVKNTLGKDYDVYVINESGVIIRTTYAPELGLDFKSIPYFYEYLTKIRGSEGFFADHIVRDKLGEGILRKFAYMPSPDHRYIFELGFTSHSFDELTYELANTDKIEQIVRINPFIENFTIYNTMGREIHTNELPDPSEQGYLNEVIKNRQTLEVRDPENKWIFRYLFIDLQFDEYGSDSSRIVKLTYSTKDFDDALFNLLLYHLLLGLIAIGVGFGIAFVLVQRITRPIKQIAQDVNIIARGDLEHRIGTTHSSEFGILENSINLMIDSIKDSMQKVTDSKILQRELIDQLPVAIFMKDLKDGKYVAWNKASEQIFEKSGTEVIGRTDKEVFSQKMVSFIEKEDKEVMLNRVIIRNKKIESGTRGYRIIHMIIVPIFDSSNTMRYILGTGEDLTEETLNMKIDLIFSITRREILDQLSVIVSHLERAQLKASPEAMQTFFSKTIASIEAIRNQMAFARSLQDIGIISPAWQSVKNVFWSAFSLVPASNIDIHVDVDDIELYADPLLPRVFYNLIVNSVQHGEHHLTKIRLSARESGDSLVLIYEDNGTGIPSTEKEKIFEFGYGKKTGLGLFLTREILGYSGMMISETGEPGKGARFEIVVPKNKFRKALSK